MNAFEKAQVVIDLRSVRKDSSCGCGPKARRGDISASEMMKIITEAFRKKFGIESEAQKAAREFWNGIKADPEIQKILSENPDTSMISQTQCAAKVMQRLKNMPNFDKLPMTERFKLGRSICSLPGRF